MPCTYRIDRERRLVISTGTDTVNFADCLEHQEKLLSDPEFEATFDQLLDASKTKSFDVTIHQVRALSERRVFSTGSRRAVVAPPTALFTIARAAQLLHAAATGNHQVAVFRDLESAMRWIEEGRPDMSQAADAS